jgi:hypothetical protein
LLFQNSIVGARGTLPSLGNGFSLRSPRRLPGRKNGKTANSRGTINLKIAPIESEYSA